MGVAARLLAGLFLVISSVVLAEGPEQIEQLEPGAGEWQAEYQGTSGGGRGAHSLEVMYGVGGQLAVGLEIEGEYEQGDLTFDTIGAKALFRFTDDDAPIGIGLMVQAGVDSDLALAEAEARLIVTKRSPRWWAQSNVILRRANEAGASTVSLAYAGSLQHKLGGFAWLGIEASGSSRPLWRDGGATIEHGHFAGPSLTFDVPLWGGTEVELGLAYLHRVAGEGAAHNGRLFVQLSF